jgi:two-component system, sensor histidine kinase and response regulator
MNDLLEKAKILIVDDSPTQIILIGEISEVEYDIIVANNGPEALELVKDELPDLILMDIIMPKMDGFEVCRRLKADPETCDIPIIFVTVAGDMANEAIGFELGAVDFITKPIHPLKLRYRMRTHLELQRQRRAERQNREPLADMVTILERRSADLKRQGAYLLSILSNAMDAIITIEVDGKIKEFNPAAEQLFGYSAAAVKGQDVAELIVPVELRERHREALAFHAGQKGKAPVVKRRIEVPGLRSDGTLVDLEVSLTAVYQSGQPTYTAFVHDITERKQLLKSLKETLEVAEFTSRAKDEFLANMSHEIRSPMNAIMGMTDLVLATQLTEDQQENLEIVQNSAKNLLGIINDVLDYSKIEAGQLSLEQTPFDLRGRIENICEGLAVIAHQKELELYCDIALDLPPLSGDPLRLSQIINNLVSNAFKFTTEGEVVVGVEQMYGQVGCKKDVYLHFWVSDTGIGIPADRTTRIFDQFTQVDGSTTRKYGGTGLGLAISRRLVKMMDGDIWVESVEGGGSVFHFSAGFGSGHRAVSCRDSAEARNYQPGASHLAGVRVLVADANPTGGRIIKGMLGGFGADVEVVADSSSLMELLRSAAEEGRHVDVVLLDYALLSTQSGQLLNSAIDSSKLLLMMPIHIKPHELASATNLQNTDFLKKPVKLYPLLRKINKILGRVEEIKEKKVDISAHNRRNTIPLRILLVEDLENNQKLATDILERVGHTVVLADNGREALEIMAADNFDLILMDIHMPEMDGYEATQQIRSGDGIGTCSGQIPIIAVTARVMQAEEDRCMALGMDGYLRKPYRSAELLAVIKPFTKVRKVTLKKKVSKAKIPIFKPVDADSERFQALTRNFLKEGPESLQRLGEALQVRKIRQIVKEVEVLKSSAVAVGANRVKISAIRLKGKAEMKNWDETQEMFSNLGQEVHDAILALSHEKDE